MLKIKVYYNPNNTACPTLGHFESNWLHNENLHPELKKIPVDFVLSEVNERIYVAIDKQGVADFAPLRLDLLSDYLIENHFDL